MWIGPSIGGTAGRPISGHTPSAITMRSTTTTALTAAEPHDEHRRGQAQQLPEIRREVSASRGLQVRHPSRRRSGTNGQPRIAFRFRPTRSTMSTPSCPTSTSASIPIQLSPSWNMNCTSTQKLTITAGFKYSYFNQNLTQYQDNGKTVGCLGGTLVGTVKHWYLQRRRPVGKS